MALKTVKILKTIVTAAWKTVDVRYGECCAMMLLDEKVFDDLFASLQDSKSTWHLFTADHAEIWNLGADDRACWIITSGIPGLCQSPKKLTGYKIPATESGAPN